MAKRREERRNHDERSEAEAPRPADLEAAERLFGVTYGPEERVQVRGAWTAHARGARQVRELGLPHDLEPAVSFSARLPRSPLPAAATPAEPTAGPGREPGRADEAVHLSLVEVAAALRAGRITSLDLTRAYLDRIERLDPRLEAFVTLFPEAALARAAEADRERSRGLDRGPLHGIPYAAKDLLAAPGAPTTWGARPYRDQVLEGTATVLARLEEAGAVLLGKSSLGALAMGDVWFGGTTRNPWDVSEGSSGSSAGSAAAVAAGLCTFALGSETMGSILSPSGRCGVVGLRPTFGRVSRHGAMALSWSLDRLGPITRSPEDAALVLAAVQGPDGLDGTVLDAPFPWDPAGDAASLRVGIPGDVLDAPDAATSRFLERARSVGASVERVELPDLPTQPIRTILMVEASAAFDELVRSGRVAELVRQDDEAWPTLLRAARLTSATDYVQAQRLRRRMQTEMAALFERIDVIATPNGHERAMLLGNAAGLPAVSLPCGARQNGRPLGNVALLARAFHDHEALALAHAVHREEGPLRVPPGFEAGS